MASFNQIEFSQRIGSAKSFDEIKSVVGTELSKFGYYQFDYILTPRNPDGNLGTPLELENMRDDWKHFYSRNQLFRSDPIVRHALESKQILMWSELLDNAEKVPLSDSERSVMQQSHDWGMGNGVSIPLRSTGSYLAGLGLVADKDWCTHDHARYFEDNQPALITLANTLHSLVSIPQLAVQKLELSPRELEVLRWVADGHKLDVVAHKTGTTYSTVDKQISSARRKLGATTTAQAIARFVSLGLYEQ